MNHQALVAAIALLALQVLGAEAGAIRPDGERNGLSRGVECLVANVAALSSVQDLLSSVEGDLSEVSETLDDTQQEAPAANENFLNNSLKELANIVSAAAGDSLAQFFARRTPVQNVAEGGVASSMKERPEERKEGPVSATVRALTALRDSVQTVLSQSLKALRNEENTLIKAVKDLQKSAKDASTLLRAEYNQVLEKFEEKVDKAMERAQEIISKVEQCVGGAVPNQSASSNSTMEFN